jgi:hypothetical protein
MPSGIVRVSESGLRTSEDLLRLRRAGYDAFLIVVLAPMVLLFGLQALLIFWVVLLAAGLAASTIYARLI